MKKEIASFYPCLLPEHLEDLLPSYIPLFVVRLVTYGGVIVTTYHTDGEPLFFEHGVRIVPSGEPRGAPLALEMRPPLYSGTSEIVDTLGTGDAHPSQNASQTPLPF